MQYGPTLVSDTSVQTPKINQISFILGPIGSKQIDRFSLIFVDFRSFARFSTIFIEVLNMAENLEKQSFTFFAFLPPYIGVSGSLVSRKRKRMKRSIDWYQKKS